VSSLAGDTVKLFVITRGERDCRSSQNLTRNLGVALTRLEPSEAQPILSVVAEIHIGIRLTRIQPPQSLGSDGGIFGKSTQRHLLDVGGGDLIVGSADVGTRTIPGPHQGGAVELQASEPDLRVLSVIEPLLGLELLLDVGEAQRGGDTHIGLDIPETSVRVGLFEGVVLDGAVDVDRGGVKGIPHSPTTSDGAVSAIGITIPRSRDVVVQSFREAVPVGNVPCVDTVEVEPNGHLSTDGHISIGHTAFDQLKSRIGTLVDNLNVLFGKSDVHLPELDVELELLFNLRFRDVELLTLQVRSTDQAVIVASCYSKLLHYCY